MTTWSDVLVRESVSTIAERFTDIVKAAVGVVQTLASFFPVPGPDADARFAQSLLRLADAFDFLDTLALEIMARTIAQLPIPKDWGHRVIRADDAARIFLGAFAKATYDASNAVDQPAEASRQAYVVKRWKYLLSQAWSLYWGDWPAALVRYLRKFIKVSPLKWIMQILTFADVLVKVGFTLAGLVIAVGLLSRLQPELESRFLQQRTPRSNAKLQGGGVIRRREPGGSRP